MSSFKYPPTAANGKLLLSEDYAREAIIQAVQTRLGERVFRNTYGNDLDEFSVVSDTASVIAELEDSIISSTQDYLPISLAITGSMDDDGTMYVHIAYDDDERVQTIDLKL